MTWFAGLGEMQATIAVDDGEHTARWAGGELVLDAHPDPDADAALAALGGDRCLCLDVLDAWRAQFDDLSILTVGRRDGAEPFGIDPAVLELVVGDARRWRNRFAGIEQTLAEAGDRAGLARLDAVAGPADRALSRRVGFLRLLALPAVFTDRLQASVVASCIARWYDDAFRQRVEARLAVSVAARAGPALRRAGLAEAALDVRLAPPGTAAEVTPSFAVLPLDWLPDVWGRGAASVGGRFVTAVHDVRIEGERARLVADVAGGGKVELARGVDECDTEWSLVD